MGFLIDEVHRTCCLWKPALFRIRGFLPVLFLWSWVTKKIGALKTANYVYINPISTVIISAIFLKEPMAPMAIAGSFFILTGVFIANRQNIR